MSTPRNENLSGKPTLGRYVILREVARSNDIVYEAVDPTINRRIAIKELNIAPTLTGQARRERIERFFREGRAAGAMNHPNIVTIFEIGEDHGRFFIAMEFLEGQSLRDRLQTVGPFPLTEAISITTALCDALSFAHERGVIHRDIKPDNVHILPGGQVKLTDFGIARILGEDQLTMAGQVFGTPSYMSPEQVTGNPLDPRTDQYSLAVLLYEMLTGRKPFTGDSVVTITYRIIHEPVPVPPGVPHEVAQVMERAMAKSPESRFGSVLEFRNALMSAAEYARSGAHNNAQVYSMPVQQQPIPMGPPTFRQNDPLAPGLPIGVSATGSQPTMQYSAQTMANPMGAGMQPHTTGGNYNPAQTGGYNQGDAQPRRNNIGAIAVSVIVLLGVVAGAGFAVKSAFQNMSAGQSREKIVKIYSEGAALYEQKQYAEAAALFKKVREAGGGDALTLSNAKNGETYCYRMLGQKAQSANDLPNAEMYFTKALEVSPDDAQAQSELVAVKRLRGTDTVASTPGGGGQTVTASNGEKIDTSKTPLAGLFTPTPGTNGDNSVPTTLASPSPLGVLPGSQSTADFASKNQKAAQDAQTLLNRGDLAFKNGQRDEAVNLWRDAVTAGPGSQAAVTAGDRIAKFGASDPLGGM